MAKMVARRAHQPGQILLLEFLGLGPITEEAYGCAPLIKSRRNFRKNIWTVLIRLGGRSPVLGFAFPGRKILRLSVAAPGRGRSERLTIGGRHGPRAETARQGAVPDVPALGPRNSGGAPYLFTVFVLSWPRREDSASRTETSGDFFRAKRSRKPFFDCGGQACRIISDISKNSLSTAG